MEVTLTILLAFALALAVIGARLRVAHRGLDRPNHRSLHERPTPHGGGLGVVLPILAAGFALDAPAALLAAVSSLAVISLLDDLRSLPFWLRLASHLAAALWLCSYLGLPVAWWPPTTLAIGWMTNLYNFMDGADGLAGSQGVAGFSAYAAGFALAGDPTLAIWCGAMAAACAGFLCFNWPPARIFMGDVGSIPLGFLAGGLGAWGVWWAGWPLWFPLMAFAPFVLDASATLVRRALTGKRVWEAHREHVYQRMVRMGYGHRGMTLRWAALMTLGSLLATGMLALGPIGWPWGGALTWMCALGLLGWRVDRRWREMQIDA